jgi:anaerobic selenocysteine-containing dehydrogenase
MTDTAKMADIVLPATMFLEHNDYYRRGGHTRVLFGPKVVEAPGECRSNFEVVNELLRRLGADHASMHLTDREMVAETFRRSGFGELEEIEKTGFIENPQPVSKAHFADGFGWPDGRYRFAPNWQGVHEKGGYTWVCDPAEMPRFADHWDVTERIDEVTPFRLSTSPARAFLNSTFTETAGSRKRHPEPTVFIHPEDAAALSIADGDMVVLGNARGEVPLKAVYFDGIQRGVLIAEGIHPNSAHATGVGINTLIGSDQVRPFGGAAFHDTSVWLRRV